jgi:hypothetical protein
MLSLVVMANMMRVLIFQNFEQCLAVIESIARDTTFKHFPQSLGELEATIILRPALDQKIRSIHTARFD